MLLLRQTRLTSTGIIKPEPEMTKKVPPAVQMKQNSTSQLIRKLPLTAFG